MHLPSNLASRLNQVFLLFELYAVVRSIAVHPELLFGRESRVALRARHLEGRLELNLLVRVQSHLSGVVLTVLLLADLVLGHLSVALEELLADEALDASAALVPPFGLHLVVRTEGASTPVVTAAGLLSLQTIVAFLNDAIYLVKGAVFIQVCDFWVFAIDDLLLLLISFPLTLGLLL